MRPKRFHYTTKKGTKFAVTAVAEVGPLLVTKTVPGDLIPGCRKWEPIMGFRLTVRVSGLACGWFPSVELALVEADNLMLAVPDLWDVCTASLNCNRQVRPDGALLVKRWAREYGDPLREASLIP